MAGAPEQEITVAGVNTTGKAARVTLRVGDWIFEAPAWFCDPWPGDFGLLGINGFWRYFEVRIDPDQEVTECR